ncbi:hypothetical protein GUJ93_ZPchr0013g36838 [Zizania palustris]|uniref:Uncharacterized protein n=1 Tax=Zizania palustris TaxID=103762 RepID=A0A8J6BYB5_ZIZPA|nr:hypothetical protein GUJ93_ZPchr0013g36838 [Zizania palustris]
MKNPNHPPPKPSCFLHEATGRRQSALQNSLERSGIHLGAHHDPHSVVRLQVPPRSASSWSHTLIAGNAASPATAAISGDPCRLPRPSPPPGLRASDDQEKSSAPNLRPKQDRYKVRRQEYLGHPSVQIGIGFQTKNQELPGSYHDQPAN